jgi:nucleolar GTP-binding protein
MRNPYLHSFGYSHNEILNVAFHYAAEQSSRVVVRGSKAERAMQKEGIRIKAAAKRATELLKSSYSSFPRNVPEFYKELADVLIGIDKLNHALRTEKKVIEKINDLKIVALKKLEKCNTTSELRKVRQAFYGLVSKLLKRKSAQLLILKDAGKVLKKLPNIEEMPTIIIAGMPNVGKSSLLWQLTGSKPEIQPYPFTTKGLMIGYLESGFKRIQIFDTPGLLDRPLEKRNKIELQTIVALKRLANAIVFIIDASETCGWNVESQVSLYHEIMRLFNKKTIIAINKIDVLGGKEIKDFPELSNAIKISCTTGEGIEKLKDEILKVLKI